MFRLAVVRAFDDREAEIMRVPDCVAAVAVRQLMLQHAQERQPFAGELHHGKVVYYIDGNDRERSARTVVLEILERVFLGFERRVGYDMPIRYRETVRARDETRADGRLGLSRLEDDPQLQQLRADTFENRFRFIGNPRRFVCSRRQGVGPREDEGKKQSEHRSTMVPAHLARPRATISRLTQC